MEVGFSVNQYDGDGDVYDKCILIHINNNLILRFGSYEEYESFVAKLEGMKKEIKENL